MARKNSGTSGKVVYSAFVLKLRENLSRVWNETKALTRSTWHGNPSAKKEINEQYPQLKKRQTFTNQEKSFAADSTIGETMAKTSFFSHQTSKYNQNLPQQPVLMRWAPHCATALVSETPPVAGRRTWNQRILYRHDTLSTNQRNGGYSELPQVGQVGK